MYLTLYRLTRTTGHKKDFKTAMFRRLSWHFYGRRRNCYALSIRYVHRALQHANQGRKQKKKDMKQLWKTRIMAACQEHDIDYETFMTTLGETRILLNRKTLADLAIFEPRTFQSLCEFCKQRSNEVGLGVANLSSPSGVITRGML